MLALLGCYLWPTKFVYAQEKSFAPVLSVIDPAQTDLLANFQIELIVDCSTSMSRRDCPHGLSRWQWCGMQSQALSNALASCLPAGFTVTTFSGKYEVHKQASPQIVREIFEHPILIMALDWQRH